MLNFIASFLTNRTLIINGNEYNSLVFSLENGVPQGSTLSVTLFIIVMNSITEGPKFIVNCRLFVDDLNIFCETKFKSSWDWTSQINSQLLNEERRISSMRDL